MRAPPQRCRRLSGAAFAFLFGIVLSPDLARAAVPEPPPLVPPHAVHEEPAEYPPGATGSASVILELVVETNGDVGDVRVVEGAGPFAAAAIAAVQRYRFEPARRGDVTVRARIRIVVAFTAAVDVPIPSASAPPEEIAPAPPAPRPERVAEVTIAGSRTQPTSSPTEHRLARADIRLVPGAFGDPYRAIDMLPGVVPTVSGLPYYYIRGAPPSAVGYFVDEVRVPYLFHFALGPGVIQPAIIDEVSLHPAAFPGRFGRYAGAVVAGKTREPATELSGEATIRVFDAGAYAESPFAKGRGSVGIGGRYSYTAAILSAFAPGTTIDYRDYNARASFDIDEHWRVSTLILGAYDFASQLQTDPDGVERERVLFASEFHRLDLRLDHRGSDGSTSRIATTLGLDRTRIEGARFAQDFVFGLRGRHRLPLRPDLDVEAGLDTTIDRYLGDLPSPYSVSRDDYRKAEAFFSPRTESATGAWLSATWHPAGPWGKGKGFELTGTARADVFTSDGSTEIGPSPRVSMRVPLSSRIAFLGALGVGAQPPAFAIPIPAVGYRRLPGGLGFGWQKSAGLESELPLKFLLRTVGFHHSYFNLRDFARNGSDVSLDEPQPVPSSPAQAYGLEVFLSRRLSERVGAFVSYTLSRSEIGATATTPERVSPFDRTHVLQVGSSVDLGAGWRASARFLTYRGWPDEGPSAGNLVPIGRLPAFYRVDARIEKRWRFRKAGYISLVLEALNATAQKEILSRSCELGRCRDEKIGPIVAPSIGVEGAL